MRKFVALLVVLTFLLALAGCDKGKQAATPNQSELPETDINSAEKADKTDSITILNEFFDTLTVGKSVTITLEQGGNSQSYKATLDEYWAMRMPTDEEFDWRETDTENESGDLSAAGKNENYSLSLSSNLNNKLCTLTVQNGSNYSTLTHDHNEYRFIGAEEYAYDTPWTAAAALRSSYDTVEYESLGGLYDDNITTLVPNNGQDYLAAALAGYQQQEEAHLNVSSGGRFCFSFVECSVTAEEEQTDHFRKEGIIDENTWAVGATTIFVPENELAYHESMAGNTTEYSGDDANIPAGALVYYRVGYVTLSDEGWHVDIGGTGW